MRRTVRLIPFRKPTPPGPKAAEIAQAMSPVEDLRTLERKVWDRIIGQVWAC